MTHMGFKCEATTEQAKHEANTASGSVISQPLRLYLFIAGGTERR